MTPRKALASLQRFLSEPRCIPPDLAEAILWLEAERQARVEPEPLRPRLGGSRSAVVEDRLGLTHASLLARVEHMIADAREPLRPTEEETAHNVRPNNAAIGSQGSSRWGGTGKQCLATESLLSERRNRRTFGVV